MKAIILAAGKGTRLLPLTDNTPKPLIKIYDKTILEWNLESIYKYVDEIIIIIKHNGEKIVEKIGDNYKGTKIIYKEQSDKKGTGGALMGLDIDLDILILNGDSIFDKKDIEKLLKYSGYGVLVKKVDNPEKYGIFVTNSEGFINRVVEKPSEFVGDLASLGAYKISSKLLEINENIDISERGEYELTCSINEYVKNLPLKAIQIEGSFIDISYPWDILSANKYFLDKLAHSEIKGEIEDGVVIKGNIVLEKGAIIKSGTYIEGNCYFGEGTVVGPSAYVRGNTVTGNNCKIGFSSEVKNSYIGDNSKMPHIGVLGDSIVGNNSNLAGGFIVANLRHDSKSIKVMVKGELVDTGLKKLGSIIGDNVNTGIRTTVYPGRILVSNSSTLPGEIVK